MWGLLVNPTALVPVTQPGAIWRQTTFESYRGGEVNRLLALLIVPSAFGELA